MGYSGLCQGVYASDIHIAERIGREAHVVESQGGIHHYWQDPTKRIQLAGRCEVDWKTGVDRMIATRRPELLGR